MQIAGDINSLVIALRLFKLCKLHKWHLFAGTSNVYLIYVKGMDRAEQVV